MEASDDLNEPPPYSLDRHSEAGTPNVGCAAAQQVTRGGGAGRSRGRAGSRGDVSGGGGGGERAVASPPPRPARTPLAGARRRHSTKTLYGAGRLRTSRARGSGWRPCRLLPQPVPRPPAGAATCVPPVPPRPSPTPRPCPLPARRRAWPAVRDRKEQTLGSFGGGRGGP